MGHIPCGWEFLEGIFLGNAKVSNVQIMCRTYLCRMWLFKASRVKEDHNTHTHTCLILGISGVLGIFALLCDIDTKDKLWFWSELILVCLRI